MYQDHNLKKGTLSVADFRVKLQFNKFFKQGDRLTVGNLLKRTKDRGDVKSIARPSRPPRRPGP